MLYLLVYVTLLMAGVTKNMVMHHSIKPMLHWLVHKNVRVHKTISVVLLLEIIR